MRSSTAGSKGFTLVEVLVSMMIMAITLTVIMGLFSGGLRSKFKAQEYDNAISYARNKMEEVLLSDQWEVGVTEGKSDSGYHWKVDISDAAPPETGTPPGEDQDLKSWNISIDISWNDGIQEKTYSVTTVHIP